MDTKAYIGLTVTVLLFGLAMFWFGRATISVPPTVVEEIQEEQEMPADTLTGWQIFRMAMIKTESEFNSKAVGKAKDYGIFQITPIYTKEANRLLGHEEYKHEDAFDPVKSLEMFDIVQSHYNPDLDIDTAIRKHNPGGASIGYARKIHENIIWIMRMEDIRKTIIEYDSSRAQ